MPRTRPSSESVAIEQNTKVNSIFARHETFHLRFGWLKKGFDAAVEDPEIFLKPDANVRLGVGKNMVQSIRYWCTAFKVLKDPSRFKENTDLDTSGLKGLYPTEIGTRLLGEKGWDPFLEDPASLWLLHWNLLKPPCYATAWYFTFNLFYKPEFLQKHLLSALNEYRDLNAPNIANSSIEKDVSCILRMYVEQDSKNNSIEENIDCPFTELGCIYPIAASDEYYSFRVGSKTNLPAEIIVAACLEFASWTEQQEQGTIALHRLLFDPGSPGMVFKLSESALHEAIDRVAHWSKQTVTVSANAGLVQLEFSRNPNELMWEVLSHYYETGRGRTAL